MVYAASCNPPRKAKRLPIASTATTPTSSEPTNAIPIQPRKEAKEAECPASPDGETVDHPRVPAKRGRKPGPLSRSAREAQRRLNHSIIEKARRTKINDALATLRELVPVDYGQPKSPVLEAVDSDVDEDVGEYRPASGKPNKAGKKQEKEKEFKLEILVRTVTFMKDLIKRVAELEMQVAGTSRPEESLPTPTLRKRRLSQSGVDDEAEDALRASSRPRRDSFLRPQGPDSDHLSRTVSTHHPSLDGPLPSISSWLPESNVGHNNAPASKAGQSPRDISFYLPSPPSSHFDPVRNSYHPPSLNLGPQRSSSNSFGRPARTVEDETAATLLIHMSTSPTFLPVSQGLPLITSPSTRSPTSGCIDAPSGDPSGRVLSQGSSTSRSSSHSSPTSAVRLQAQTPASLLGLTHILKS